MRFPAAILLALALSGCAPSGPQLVRLDLTPRPARAPEHVDVLDRAPDRDHIIIAEWRTTKESIFDERRPLRDEARRQAARLGADAVVVHVREGIGHPVRSPSMTPGVATEPGETTIATTEIQVQAQFIVWR